MIIPYATKGQELGETRQAMTKTLMQDIEKVINKYKDKKGKYYLLVHAKPFPDHNQVIKIKMVAMNIKPSMMLSCLLFGIDNDTGTLTLEWALPGDWPTWAVGGSNEPVPEVIASINQCGVRYHYDDLLPS
jgi:hypothetical protein